MAQIALAWIMNKDPVAAPIVGTTNLQNLKDLVGAFLFSVYKCFLRMVRLIDSCDVIIYRCRAYQAHEGRDEVPRAAV